MKNYDDFPSLRDFDFGLYSSFSGSGTILVPDDKGIYKGKRVGFGETALIPYLQDHFNEDSIISFNQLIENLRANGDTNLLPSKVDEVLKIEPFLNKTLRKFRHFGLCAMLDIDLPSGSINLSKGDTYDSTRVFAMTPHETNQKISNGQKINQFTFD